MRLHVLFADILEPPRPLLSDQVNECVSALSSFHREAADLMIQFRAFLDRTPLRRVEEIYTDTFDPHAGCHPYLGYYLFGDGDRRRTFLAGLEELYQVYHFCAADEAPDHLGMMLRFLGQVGDEETTEEMTFLHILPALKRMLKGLAERTTPYKEVLQALWLTLRDGQETQNGWIPIGVPESP